MIRFIQATDGYAANLPCLKGKKFRLTSGFNVLFGPNGVGKSTLLRLAGAYAGCPIDTGGWSRCVDPQYVLSAGGYPKLFATRVRPCTARVSWDGSPAFYTSSATTDQHQQTLDDKTDGAFSSLDRVRIALSYDAMNAGNLRMVNLVRRINALSTPPDLLCPMDKRQNSTWESAHTKFVKYVRRLPRGGPITALFDEPDRCLDLLLQEQLFLRVLPALAKNIQVIVATHSVLALYAPCNLIDLEDGYAESCRSRLHSLCALKLGTE